MIMKFKRLLKAGEPNPNIGKPISNLEEKLKEYFDLPGAKPICLSNDIKIQSTLIPTLDGVEIFGFANSFDSDSVDVTLTPNAIEYGINPDDYCVSFISTYDKKTNTVVGLIHIVFSKK